MEKSTPHALSESHLRQRPTYLGGRQGLIKRVRKREANGQEESRRRLKRNEETPIEPGQVPIAITVFPYTNSIQWPFWNYRERYMYIDPLSIHYTPTSPATNMRNRCTINTSTTRTRVKAPGPMLDMQSVLVLVVVVAVHQEPRRAMSWQVRWAVNCIG